MFSGSPGRSSQMLLEELCRAAVGQICRYFIAASTEFGGKTVIQPFIIMHGDFRVIVQTFMHSGLCLGWNKSVSGRNMQHHIMGNRMAFAQQTVNSYA